MQEHSSPLYPPRTFSNARDSQATLRFAINFSTAGEKCTLNAIKQYNRPYRDIHVLRYPDPSEIAQWLKNNHIEVLNVAGNREKTWRGMGDFVEEYLVKVFTWTPPVQKPTQSSVLKIIADKIAGCHRCSELSEYREANCGKTVPGEGNPNADLMIIGEAPGADEAEQGRPFVGRAGKLLDSIIEAAGWKREELFIANILKCRPPGNRVPTDEEAANCRQYLDFQIKAVNPNRILCLGKTASRFLLGKGEEVTMGSMRGEHEYQGRKVICSYHPSYLLRNPEAKADLWHDIQPFRELTNE
jgi:uracil-DNA glycosylase family 4